MPFIIFKYTTETSDKNIYKKQVEAVNFIKSRTCVILKTFVHGFMVKCQFHKIFKNIQ